MIRNKKICAILIALSMLMSLYSNCFAASKDKDKEIAVVVNGSMLTFDVPPKSINGRTLVPLRTIFETLGAEVKWDDQTKTVTGIKGGTTVSLQVGSTTAKVNGETKTLDVPAAELDGRTLVPARFIAESMGCTVLWDEEKHAVKINTPIIVDGKLDDWGKIKPIAEDAEGDTSDGAADLLELNATMDDSNLYIAEKVKGNDPIVDFELDTNNDSKIDYILFSNFNQGISQILKVDTNQMDKTSLNSVPVVIGDIMELKVPLSDIGNPKQLRIRIEVQHIKGKADAGKEYDAMNDWYPVY